MIEVYKEQAARLETNLVKSIQTQLGIIGESINANFLELCSYPVNGFYEHVKEIKLDDDGDVVLICTANSSEEVILMEEAIADSKLHSWDLIAILENLINYGKSC